MEGLIPYIIGAINRKQKTTFGEHMMNTSLQHSDSSKRLLLGSSDHNNSFNNGSFRARTRLDTTPPITANNNLRNRKHYY
ncbi:hypothetical protein P8452_45206 [Trifolium repens]|jgi:hypothetical protein|nr:hypothetical protein P8452_45206 [Trifolium repens]